jgi:hypothetical protein
LLVPTSVGNQILDRRHRDRRAGRHLNDKHLGFIGMAVEEGASDDLYAHRQFGMIVPAKQPSRPILLPEPLGQQRALQCVLGRRHDIEVT